MNLNQNSPYTQLVEYSLKFCTASTLAVADLQIIFHTQCVRRPYVYLTTYQISDAQLW